MALLSVLGQFGNVLECSLYDLYSISSSSSLLHSLLILQVRVDSMMKVAEIEEAEKQKMRNKYVINLPLH